MAVLVTNESGQDYRFSGASNQKLFPDGTTMLISDDEWDSVITGKRGPGQLNPEPLPVDVVIPPITLDPAPSYALAILLDDVGGGVSYVGEADPGSSLSTLDWRIKRITEVGADVTVEWADGVATFNKEWDERTSYAYS